MSEVTYDESIYYPYTEPCKALINQLLNGKYSLEEAELLASQINESYINYLKKFNRNLGGKSNSRNGVGGTYDCIALCCVYELCKDKVSLMDIEELEKKLFLTTFKKLSFVDLNNPILKRLYHFADSIAAKKGNKIDDYHMVVEPYDVKQPIRYHFTSCPVAEFAKQFGFDDVLPYLCNADFFGIELMHGKLIRKNTLGNGDVCDYAICGNKDPYVKEHEEYRDEAGYIRNTKRRSKQI